MTYQTGADATVRAEFIANGKLPDTQDTSFRAVSDNWPVFALAHSLGSVSTASDPVLYSIGHVRDPAIEYIVANGALQSRSAYFWSAYSSVPALVSDRLQGRLHCSDNFPRSKISDFLGDYSAALSRANTFDEKVNTDASKISSDYASIVALSIRQAFAATEITISKTSSGEWNTSDVKMFMKEISSDGVRLITIDCRTPLIKSLLGLECEYR